MERIDEMTNEELARKGHSDHVLRAEFEMVERVICRNALTGADLSHWFDRSKILRSLIHSGTRAA